MPIVPMNIADSIIPYVVHNEFSRHNETEKQNTDSSHDTNVKHLNLPSQSENEKQIVGSSQYGFEEQKKDPSQICGEKH